MSKYLVIGLISSFWIIFIHSAVVKRAACADHEVAVECAHCGPKRCDQLGYPIPCGGATSRCQPECVCLDGHVRDINGTCIPKTNCPACAGDHNATSGCGNHCGNSCSDYMETNKTCFSGCLYNSCNCKSGYRFHDQLRKCVLPIDCCK